MFRKNTVFKIIITLCTVLLIIGLGVGYYFYSLIFSPNVSKNNGEMQELFIPTQATYQQVIDSLVVNNIVKNIASFDWVAKKMNYPSKIYGGRYLIKPESSNRELLIMLRTGAQTPYHIAINNIRLKEQLITLVGKKLEADSIAFIQLLTDTVFLAEKGFTPNNVLSIFMADTYEFNWNTSVEQFFSRMLREYQHFWNDKRLEKAKTVHLSPFEVIILAAIVEEEMMQTDEIPRIAGVYLNRLRKGWKMESDPTIKYALKDFTIKRLLNRHKKLAADSPYNTYEIIGLPPGPIRIPSKKAIEGVLNAEEHGFLFFCAKEDFSGYHNFAVRYNDHLLNARRYQKALTERGIMH